MPTPNWRRLTDLASIVRFGLLALVPIAGLGLVLGYQLQQYVEREELDATQRAGALMVRVGVQPLLQPEDLSGNMSPARIAALDSALSGGLADGGVERVKVWNRDGVIVYSDNHSLIGRRFEVDHDLRTAFAGATHADLTLATDPEHRDDSLTGTLVQVYVPLIFAGGSAPSGAFEVYLDYGRLQQTVRHETGHLWLLLTAGLALIYALMFPAALASERWRRRADAAREMADDERRRRDEAERMTELKSRFLATMSHELRTPLNSILGFAQLLRMPNFGSLGEKQQRYLDNIESSGRHLLDLVNDVLDMAKIEAGRLDLDMGPLGVVGVLEDATELLDAAAAAREVRLRVDAAADATVIADRRRLTQVVVNLVSNAIKFTPAGGKVDLVAGVEQGQVVVDVRDTGTGIVPEEQALVFEEFRQSDSGRSSGAGTGLGLPISRRLMQLMGGDLTLLSSSETGTVFRIQLDAAG